MLIRLGTDELRVHMLLNFMSPRTLNMHMQLARVANVLDRSRHQRSSLAIER